MTNSFFQSFNLPSDGVAWFDAGKNIDLGFGSIGSTGSTGGSSNFWGGVGSAVQDIAGKYGPQLMSGLMNNNSGQRMSFGPEQMADLLAVNEGMNVYGFGEQAKLQIPTARAFGAINTEMDIKALKNKMEIYAPAINSAQLASNQFSRNAALKNVNSEQTPYGVTGFSPEERRKNPGAFIEPGKISYYDTQDPYLQLAASTFATRGRA